MHPLTYMTITPRPIKPILSLPTSYFRVLLSLVFLVIRTRKEEREKHKVMQGKMARGTVLTQAFVIQAHFLPAACQPMFHVRKKFSPKIKRLKTGGALGSEWGVCFLDYWRTILNSGNCISELKHHKKRKAGPRSQCLAVLADRSSHEGAGDVGSNPRTSVYSLFDFEHIVVKSSVSLKINWNRNICTFHLAELS